MIDVRFSLARRMIIALYSLLLAIVGVITSSAILYYRRAHSSGSELARISPEYGLVSLALGFDVLVLVIASLYAMAYQIWWRIANEYWRQR